MVVSDWDLLSPAYEWNLFCLSGFAQINCGIQDDHPPCPGVCGFYVECYQRELLN